MRDPRELAMQAGELVYGERGADYGHPADNFSHGAALWSAYLGSKLSEPITAEDTAMMMVLWKLSREHNKPKDDNIVDAHGYLLTYGRVRRRAEGLE